MFLYQNLTTILGIPGDGVGFRYKKHNFCYGYGCRLHYRVFDPWKHRLCRPRL